MSRLLYPELSYELTGIFLEIHRTLGRFHSEKTYANAIEQKLKEHGLVYNRWVPLTVESSGMKIGDNKADFIAAGKIIIEVKAKPFITKEDYFQSRRYLAAANLELCLLVNFRSKYLKPKRILYRAT